MNFFVRKKKESSIFLLSIVWLFVFFLRAENSGFGPEDTRIGVFKGNFKLEKPNGKVFVKKILGNCDISTGAGSINLGVVEGDCFVSTEAGDIDIEEVKGTAKLLTKSGNIHIKKAGSFIAAETFIGEIVIDSGKLVHAKNTAGGDVKIMSLAGYAQVASVGNVLVMLDEEFTGSDICDLSSEVGDITIYLPERIGANVTIKTPITMNPERRTKIRSDFNFKTFDQRCGPKEEFFYMTTVINNGGRQVDLYIKRGNIYIRKLPFGKEGKTSRRE